MALPTPFLEWDWLHLLEVSNSVGAEKGWLPCHLTVWRASTLVAAAPLYIKSHSVGEFVFDHAWADVARRIEAPYYPKLVGMSPFSPAIGYRFLVAEGEDPSILHGRCRPRPVPVRLGEEGPDRHTPHRLPARRLDAQDGLHGRIRVHRVEPVADDRDPGEPSAQRDAPQLARALGSPRLNLSLLGR